MDAVPHRKMGGAGHFETTGAVGHIDIAIDCAVTPRKSSTGADADIALNKRRTGKRIVRVGTVSVVLGKTAPGKYSEVAAINANVNSSRCRIVGIAADAIREAG